MRCMVVFLSFLAVLSLNFDIKLESIMLTVNEYFDGAVKSIAFTGEKLPSSVGVMQAGEYEFKTNQFETMTVLTGVMYVKQAESIDWQAYYANEMFTVPAQNTFKVRVETDTAYLCTYQNL